MSKKLKWLLLRYFTLGVVEGEGGGEGAAAEDSDAGAEGADAGGQDDAGDLDLGAGDLDSIIEAGEAALPGDDKPAGGRENAAIRDARKRAQDAEEARLRMEGELAAERRMRQQPAQNEDQRLYEAEQKRLTDPEITDLEKWQIGANRQLRQSMQASNNALTRAAETEDRTAFAALAVTNPKVHKLYESKVEAELAKMRQAGQNAPRLALLRFMLGNDLLEGKLKGKTAAKKPAAAAAGAPAANRVARGQPPGARSDVSSKQRQTERQAREARLANQPI